MRAASADQIGTARAAFLVAAVVAVSTYSLVPGLRTVAAGATGVIAIGAIYISQRRLRLRRFLGWVLIAIAIGLLTVANVGLAYLGSGNVTLLNYPALPDYVFVLVYPPLALGLVLLGRPSQPSRNTAMLLDILALSLAGSLVVWITLVRPAIMDAALSLNGRIVAIATWVGVVSVLAAAVRVMVDWHRNAAVRYLTVGLIVFLVSDTLYGAWLIRGESEAAGLIGIGFLIFIVLCGMAVLTPAVVDIASPDYAQQPISPIRIALLAVAMLVAPTVLLVEATSGPVRTGVAIALASAGAAVVVILRLVLARRQHQRRLRCDRAAATASSALVAATSKAEVAASVAAALREMLPGDAEPLVHIESTTEHHTTLQPVRDRSIASEEPIGTLSVPLPPPALIGSQRAHHRLDVRRAMTMQAPLARLVELAPTLEAVANQAGAALNRISLVSRLRADERERYFRTLVLTSRDVTMISRGGRVEYATPSARAMFGRSIIGDQLDHLVEDVDDDWPAATVRPADGDEGRVHRADGTALAVLALHRDLSNEPTVHGVVTTLRDITAERDLRRDLAYRATHDPLTGLVNSEAFTRALDRASGPSDDGGLAVLFADLDDFKAVNDTYGHETGDRLLEVVARRISGCVRPSDIVARMGGDEFAVLLTALEDEQTARDIAQRIADALAAPARVAGIALSAQASIGLAHTTADAPSAPVALLREADAALYTAKAHGKGRWTQFRAGMTTPARRHLDARRRIEQGMTTGSLRLLYQPVVALTTASTVGFEGFIQLADAGPSLSAAELLSIADDTGLINEVGAWTLDRALRDLAQLNPGGADRYVSVNVSARQLRQPDFVDQVRRRVAEAGTDPARLVLEITEGLLVGDDYDRAWSFLADLRHDGIRVAIDDFGTGYASLAYLRQPVIDIVKIDRTFVARSGESRGRVLLEHLTGVCADLGLKQVAEGVDDSATRDTLVHLGCDWGQGHLFAPALPAAEAAAWEASPARA